MEVSLSGAIVLRVMPVSVHFTLGGTLQAVRCGGSLGVQGAVEKIQDLHVKACVKGGSIEPRAIAAGVRIFLHERLWTRCDERIVTRTLDDAVLRPPPGGFPEALQRKVLADKASCIIELKKN